MLSNSLLTSYPPPQRSPTVTSWNYLPTLPQRCQGSSNLTLAGAWGQMFVNLAKRQAVVCTSQKDKYCFLPCDNLSPATFRGHGLATPETYGDAPSCIRDLEGRQTRGACQFRHLEGPASPLLNDAAPIESTGDQWVPRQGFVRREQLRGGQPEMKVPDDVTSKRSS